jgi:hypothetical protein
VYRSSHVLVHDIILNAMARQQVQKGRVGQRMNKSHGMFKHKNGLNRYSYYIRHMYYHFDEMAYSIYFFILECISKFFKVVQPIEQSWVSVYIILED